MTKKTTLKILDQVNVKFTDLDAFTRRDMVNALKYFIESARHTPAYRLGRWDGTMSFVQVSGSTFLNLLERVLPIILDAGYEVEIEDDRPKFDFDFPVCDENLLADTNWPEGHDREGQPIMLRDYQVKAINDFFLNPQSMQSIATGAGKSIITGALSKLCEPFGRTLTIVPSKSLVLQTEVDYRNIGLDVGVYFGDRKDIGKTHTISTWQSLGALMKKRDQLESDLTIQEMIQGVCTVIVDECFAADTPVLTTTGYQAIQDIVAGTQVVNYDPVTQMFKTDTVVKLHTNLITSSDTQMYELLMDNGAVIQVTGNHKFLTTQGWKTVENLTDSDEIISQL